MIDFIKTKEGLFLIISKINTDFMKKTITDMLKEKKERKFTEAVEL